ncbi:MAG TPA: glycosyltransferase family 2 protein [Ideonella sp.]|uniref:glycosyltransferase family 2 protein n=1 Tax=Ideonella sp. TaxID=1929293 RepID=UPI002C9F539E|nr:glycosyltransferase family 2 protein [Ideonella sp.]HSI49377.1 glycosyltransferase family 2 protein [Ideonella sp.]
MTDSPVSTAYIGAAPALPADPAPPHRLSVVVPMYNEIDNVKPLIDTVQAALQAYPHPWELIVVDDGSRDGTGAALQRHAASVGPHIRVLRLLRNFRQTAAMQAGIDAARGDVIVTMDGDLQNDPRDIPRMVARLLIENMDMVAGWREKRQDGFALRRLPSMIANRLIRKITGMQFKDLGCSLKAFRTSVLREVRLYGEMHRFIPAWLATVTTPDRMTEEPVNHRAREHGESKYGLSRTFRVIVDLLSVYFFLNFGARPGHFFGAVGLAVLGFGSAVLGYLGILKLLGESIGGRPLLFVGFFCVMGGLQFLLTGVLSELLIRIYYDGSHARQYHLMATPPVADGEGWHA